jgi:hypothetical protein
MITPNKIRNAPAEKALTRPSEILLEEASDLLIFVSLCVCLQLELITLVLNT